MEEKNLNESEQGAGRKSTGRSGLIQGATVSHSGSMDGGDRLFVQGAEARYANEGNSPLLRQALQQAIVQAPGSERLRSLAAQYHVMAGELSEAREIMQPVLDRSKIQSRLSAFNALANPLSTKAAELAHPCNYYSYRYELVSDDYIQDMKSQLQVLSTWEPPKPGGGASPAEEQEKMSRYIEGVAAAAGQQARVAALAAASASDQDVAADSWYEAQAHDSGGTEEVLANGKKIFRKPRSKVLFNPAIEAARRENTAKTAAKQAAAAAAKEAIAVLQAQVGKADHVLDALTAWNAGLRAFRRQNHTGAVMHFRDCKTEVLRYLSARFSTDAKAYPVPGTEEGVYTTLCVIAKDMIGGRVVRAPGAGNVLQQKYWPERSSLATLEGLQGSLRRFDWTRPSQSFMLDKSENPLTDAVDMVRLLSQSNESAKVGEVMEGKLDAPLLTLALVHVSLAIAEAQRFGRNFDAALSECKKLDRRHQEFNMLSAAIEVPFLAILKAQILMEKADARYKRRELAPNTGPYTMLWNRFHGLTAANSYMGVLEVWKKLGEVGKVYAAKVEKGIQTYQKQLETLSLKQLHPLAVGNGVQAGLQDRQALRSMTELIPIEGVRLRTISQGAQGTPSKTNPQMHPLEPLLTFDAGSVATNPVIYALIVRAKAKLAQIEAGLNYLGYQDDFVPPWRFNFLLERARYFAEHAKGAQRDYINFLANAEREEERENSAKQAVVTAKGHLGIAQARSRKAHTEVEVSKQSKELAELVSKDANTRSKEYAAFDESLDSAAEDIQARALGRQAESVFSGALSGAATGAGIGASLGGGANPGAAAVGFILGAVVGGISSLLSGDEVEKQRNEQLDAADLQRDLEKSGLIRAASESVKAAALAGKQLESAKAGALVSAMEWSVDLMNHDFSQQNYDYLLRRQLNSEQWYRIAHGIRCVADRYLGYAVEMAFLAEQACEFENDKRIDVIRFDYDASQVGNALAGDFLLADLDSLEQDMIVSQQSKEQHVRYVVSLARDYPDALDQLRRTGSALIAVTLDRLERRFPGLCNLRIGTVEVLPIALMDPTRLSVRLTHAGAGHVRTNRPVGLNGQPTQLPYVDSWAPSCDAQWPVKMQIGQVETTVFSGLSRADQQSGFAFAMGSQRNAFERLPAAAAFHISMSMKENRIMPGALADMLISFSLSAQHDAALQAQIEDALPRQEVLTRWLSAAQSFPDGFYDFHQTGRIKLPITRDRLALTGRIQGLRNIGVVLVPSQDEPVFNAMTAVTALEFDVDAAGTVTVVTPAPLISFARNGLDVTATVVLPATAAAQWDFGEGSAPVSGASVQHAYPRAGRYLATLRLSFNGRLLEYTAALVVSKQHAVRPPLTLGIDKPVASVGGQVPAGQVAVKASALMPANDSAALTWQLGQQRPNATGTFTVAPGRHVVIATAVRPLKARLYARQRWLPDVAITVNGLSVSTNREFDANGAPINQAAHNELAKHLFGPGPLSPLDHWMMEFPLADNPALLAVNGVDEASVSLSWLDDALVSVEYECADAPRQ